MFATSIIAIYIITISLVDRPAPPEGLLLGLLLLRLLALGVVVLGLLPSRLSAVTFVSG